MCFLELIIWLALFVLLVRVVLWQLSLIIRLVCSFVLASILAALLMAVV